MAPNPEMVKSTAIARTNSFFGASPGTDVDHGNHFPQDSLISRLVRNELE